jgi:mycothiol synthase
MIAECARAVGSSPTTFESDLLDDWRRGDFALQDDTWVVESPDGDLAAYAAISIEALTTLVSFGAVHPEHCGRGIGSFLIDSVEERARNHPAWSGEEMSLLNIVLPGDNEAVSLLAARGYRKERTFQHMEINLEGVDPKPDPEGIEVRSFNPESEREAMHGLMESAFERHWDFSPTPFERWWSDAAGGPGYDPSLWWWAYIDGEPAGALTGMVRDGQGWVMDLGVLERWRGRGAGAALLRHAFAEFKRMGFVKAGLNVDSENETGATRLYGRVGMKLTQQFDFYKKAMNRADDSQRSSAVASGAPSSTSDP